MKPNILFLVIDGLRADRCYGEKKSSITPNIDKLIQDGVKKLPITDINMTRFVIRLDQGVNFVLSALFSMSGGEIFVPKIPSLNIIDLVTCMAGKGQYEIIGIRPGEKLHEIMCPADDSHLTIEFDDHFVICPSIVFYSRTNDFTTNVIGEMGRYVEQGFEYSSGLNPHFLSQNEILEYNKKLD